jgi:predicted O-methyltransferase YrrM
MSFETAWRRASEIEGWLSEDQARALYDAAGRVPSGGTIAEIGSHHGRSTVMLASGKREGVRLLAIDPWEDPRWGGGQAAYDTFKANTTGLDVECVRALSGDVARDFDGELDLLYIDGAHDRRSVLADLDGWRVRGEVFVHDAFSAKGVTLALLQRRVLQRSWRYLGSVRTLARFRREPLSPRAEVGNAVHVLGRLTYFARNAAIKLLLKHGRSARRLGWQEPSFPY